MIKKQKTKNRINVTKISKPSSFFSLENLRGAKNRLQSVGCFGAWWCDCCCRVVFQSGVIPHDKPVTEIKKIT